MRDYHKKFPGIVRVRAEVEHLRIKCHDVEITFISQAPLNTSESGEWQVAVLSVEQVEDLLEKLTVVLKTVKQKRGEEDDRTGED